MPTGAAPVVFAPEAGRGLARSVRRRHVGRRASGASSTYLVGSRGDRRSRLPLVEHRRRSAAAARARLARRSTAKGCRAARTCSSRRGCCGRSSATSTPRASWGGGRPGRRRGHRWRSARRRRPTSIFRAGAHAGGRARTTRARPLRHRPDGLRLQRGHRRLLARGGRLLDREAASASSRSPRSRSRPTSTILWKRIDAVGDDLDIRSLDPVPDLPGREHDDRRYLSRTPALRAGAARASLRDSRTPALRAGADRASLRDSRTPALRAGAANRSY